MIVYPINMLVVPLVLLVWATGFYLLAVSLRLVLGQLTATRSSVLCQALRELVDPIPNRVENWLTAWRRRPTPGWVSWVIVISAVIVARHVLVLLIVRMCQA
jgi:hypothetical protein